MSDQDLSKMSDLRLAQAAVAAGATDANGVIIDTQGYRNALFTAHFGAIVSTAVTGFKITASDSSDMSGAEDITGAVAALADSDDDKLVEIDVKAITKRYLRCVTTRATANATLNGATVRLYGGMRTKRSVHSSVDSSTVVTG